MKEGIHRRHFIKTVGMVASGAATGMPSLSAPGDEQREAAASERSQIMTVTGPIESEAMGTALPHEHIMSIFGGEPNYQPSYDVPKLLDTVLPYLESIKKLGCETIADCTAAYFGRAPLLLKQIAERTRLHLLTNTGYYGAAKDRYVPAHAYKETAHQLAKRWLREWREGIDDTGIRPGFMKIGVDDGPLSDIDRKLIQAAAKVHAESGLTIAVHTGDNPAAAYEQLSILRSEGVSPEAWIWVHAHKVTEHDSLTRAAEQGAWIELDGISETSIDHHLSLVQMMSQRGLLSRVLLSHDGNSFRYRGSPPKPYEALFRNFLPALRAAKYSTDEIRQLTVLNPRNAFAVRFRPAR